MHQKQVDTVWGKGIHVSITQKLANSFAAIESFVKLAWNRITSMVSIGMVCALFVKVFVFVLDALETKWLSNWKACIFYLVVKWVISRIVEESMWNKIMKSIQKRPIKKVDQKKLLVTLMHLPKWLSIWIQFVFNFSHWDCWVIWSKSVRKQN